MIIKKLLMATLISATSLSCLANSNDGDRAGSCFASIIFKLKNQLPVTEAQRSFVAKNAPTFEKINELSKGQCKGLSGTANESCRRKNLSSYEFDFYVGLSSTLLFINSPQDPKKLPNIEVASAQCFGTIK